jgi:phage gp36-like protein
MPYCTKQDVIDRFGENELMDLTDRDNMGVIVDSVLDQAISDASAEMDGYLGGRYQLPLVTVPPVLKALCCNIARYKLYDEQASEQVTKRFDAAIKFLFSVSKGEISLGVDATGTKAVSNDLAQMQSAGSVFARDVSKGFI